MDFSKLNLPYISIIVPVYNVERYIGKCIESIINQTFQNFEIIIVNDGSTDNSQHIIEGYQVTYKDRIFLYNKTNGGLGSARNFGIGKAVGDYFLFLDSDDWIEPNAIQELTNVIIANPNLELCVFDFFKVVNNKRSRHKGFTGKYITNISDRVLFTQVVAWNKIYKRSVFEKITFSNDKMFHEDVPTIPIILSFVTEVYYLKKSLYNYLVREGSITQKGKLTSNPDFVKALSLLAERNKQANNIFVKERYDLALYNLVYLTFSKLTKSERLPYEKEIVSFFNNHENSFYDFFELTMSFNHLKRILKNKKVL